MTSGNVTNVRLDEERPFAGLQAFAERDQAYFYGRDKEIQVLYRLVRREVLTVLFGASGIGKTSLLRAGLFPLLRSELFVPVAVRLDFTSSRPLTDSVKEKIGEALGDQGIDAPPPSPAETLWEYFHCARWLDRRNRLLTPVLVFDQFEEIFTLGHGDARVAPFLAELADLVENRIPAGVRKRLELDEEGLPFSYDRQNLRTVLVLREDFLPQLEELRGQIPSISRARFRLTQMNGYQALESILNPARHLVSHEVALEILCFAAGISRASVPIDLARVEVEPSLLSQFCHELNERRINNKPQKLPSITIDLVKRSRGKILTDFYNESLEDQSSEVRSYIEERLLTDSGFRQSEPIEEAVKFPDVSEEVLTALVDRRLLREEYRWGRLHVELIHDVLTPVVLKSRERRRARERRRELFRRFAFAGVAVFALLLAVGYAAFREWQLKREAQATRARAEGVINYILNDLRDQLESLGRLDVLEGAQGVALRYFDSLPEEDDSAASAGQRAKAFISIGDISFQRGRTQDALKFYQKALAVGEKGAARDPSNLEAWDAIGLAHEGTGRVLRQSNSRRALESYGRSRDIFRTLCERHPLNEEWCLSLARLHERIAFALSLQGKLDAAVRDYKAGLAIKLRLAARAPDSLKLQQGLATSFFGMAEVLRDTGDLRGAIESHRKSVAIRKRLVAQDPGNMYLQRWLAESLLRLGDALLERGDTRGANEQFSQGLLVSRRLVQFDPANAAWLTNLATFHEGLATTQVKRRQVQNAIDNYSQALRIRQQLVREDPENAEAVGALSWCYHLIGLAYEVAGDKGRARQEWQRSIDTIAPLIAETDQRRLLDTYARGLLRLDRIEDARPYVERLLATGWKAPGFYEALRESGYVSTER